MEKRIDPSNIPTHIAIIMDGNGRWAKKRFMPRLFGHKAGARALEKTIKAGKEFGVKIMSFFAFSTENWKRDKEEVDGIFEIIKTYLVENYDGILKEDVCVRTMGDVSKLPYDLQKILVDLCEKTKHKTGYVVNLGINYGARDEIARCFNRLIEKGKKHVDVKDIESELYTAGLADPDLVIRTSGERRLSNFMLFQCAYSELYFPKVYWPDFDKKHLKQAIISYQSRDRRYGNVKQEKN